MVLCVYIGWATVGTNQKPVLKQIASESLKLLKEGALLALHLILSIPYIIAVSVVDPLLTFLGAVFGCGMDMFADFLLRKQLASMDAKKRRK